MLSLIHISVKVRINSKQTIAQVCVDGLERSSRNKELCNNLAVGNNSSGKWTDGIDLALHATSYSIVFIDFIHHIV